MSNTSNTQKEKPDLHVIEGEQLSAVTFVQDYVQLHFDGPMLTAVTWPVVVFDGRQFEFGFPGYRDALCALIAKKVIRVSISPGDRLEICFGSGDVLSISLRPESYEADEAAIFTDIANKTWAVW